jgi:hypothetical protein
MENCFSNQFKSIEGFALGIINSFKDFPKNFSYLCLFNSFRSQ